MTLYCRLMATISFHTTFSDQTAVERFACELAGRLDAGDTLVFRGEIGAGKSVFCRSIISTLLPEPEDIPSPTFTIIQTYDTPNFEIWHCDLYRLTDISQTDELGVEMGYETALCLIEWPEILDTTVPDSALDIKIEEGEQENERHITFSGNGDKWINRLKGLCDAF